jgi:hypothetical protein
VCSTNHDNLEWWRWRWHILWVRVFLPKITVAHLVQHSSLCMEWNVHHRVRKSPPLIRFVTPTYENHTLGLWVKSQHGRLPLSRSCCTSSVIPSVAFAIMFYFLLFYDVFMQRVLNVGVPSCCITAR